MYAIKLKNDKRFINTLNGEYIISTVPLLFKSEIAINSLNGLPIKDELLEMVKVDVYAEKGGKIEYTNLKLYAIIGGIIGMLGGPSGALFGMIIGALIGNSEDVKQHKYKL